MEADHNHHPDDGESKHFSKVNEFLLDYMTHLPTRQTSLHERVTVCLCESLDILVMLN
jgi:hypothetical protein